MPYLLHKWCRDVSIYSIYWGNAGLSISCASPHSILQTSRKADVIIPIIQTRTLKIGRHAVKTGQSRGSGLFCLNSEHTCNETRTFLRSTSTILPGDMAPLALKDPELQLWKQRPRRARSLARAWHTGVDLGSYPRMGQLRITSHHRHPGASAQLPRQL